MKYILELLLTTIILFFLWNMLKRIFFSAFYQVRPPQEKATPRPSAKNVKEPSKGLNWDAETVDYEEVKEERNPNNK